MIIRKYGIMLSRVTHANIETIRQARNREDIRSKMLDQRLITPDQQEAWFASINNANNFYFIIEHNQKQVGLIHSKNIDWKKQEDEGGLFIWDESCLGSGIPVKASILLMQLCFSIVELQRTYAHTHENNKAARHYNLALGYTDVPGENRMVLTRTTYETRIDRLRMLAAGGKSLPPLSMIDIEFGQNPEEINIYQRLPAHILQKIQHRLPHTNGY